MTNRRFNRVSFEEQEQDQSAERNTQDYSFNISTVESVALIGRDLQWLADGEYGGQDSLENVHELESRSAVTPCARGTGAIGKVDLELETLSFRR